MLQNAYFWLKNAPYCSTAARESHRPIRNPQVPNQCDQSGRSSSYLNRLPLRQSGQALNFSGQRFAISNRFLRNAFRGGPNEKQTGGAWVKMQDDVANQLAVSPDDGIAWAIHVKGDIFYWNGSKFVANSTGGCATSIGVGPNSFGLSHGTPWITGCTPNADGNNSVYQMQTGEAWSRCRSL